MYRLCLDGIVLFCSMSTLSVGAIDRRPWGLDHHLTGEVRCLRRLEFDSIRAPGC